jgi:hypothetical protein
MFNGSLSISESNISHLKVKKDLIQNMYVKKKVPKKYEAKEFISFVTYFELLHCYSK